MNLVNTILRQGFRKAAGKTIRKGTKKLVRNRGLIGKVARRSIRAGRFVGKYGKRALKGLGKIGSKALMFLPFLWDLISNLFGGGNEVAGSGYGNDGDLVGNDVADSGGEGSGLSDKTADDLDNTLIGIEKAKADSEFEGAKQEVKDLDKIQSTAEALSKRSMQILNKAGLKEIKKGPSFIDTEMKGTIPNISQIQNQNGPIDQSNEIILKYKQYNPESKLDEIIGLLRSNNDLLSINNELNKLGIDTNKSSVDANLATAVNEAVNLKQLEGKESSLNEDIREEKSTQSGVYNGVSESSNGKSNSGSFGSIAKGGLLGGLLAGGMGLSSLGGNKGADPSAVEGQKDIGLGNAEYVEAKERFGDELASVYLDHKDDESIKKLIESRETKNKTMTDLLNSEGIIDDLTEYKKIEDRRKLLSGRPEGYEPITTKIINKHNLDEEPKWYAETLDRWKSFGWLSSTKSNPYNYGEDDRLAYEKAIIDYSRGNNKANAKKRIDQLAKWIKNKQKEHTVEAIDLQNDEIPIKSRIRTFLITHSKEIPNSMNYLDGGSYSPEKFIDAYFNNQIFESTDTDKLIKAELEKLKAEEVSNGPMQSSEVDIVGTKGLNLDQANLISSNDFGDYSKKLTTSDQKFINDGLSRSGDLDAEQDAYIEPITKKQGNHINSGMGDRSMNTIGYGSKLHHGIDLQANAGDFVGTPVDGEVTGLGTVSDKSKGNDIVVIRDSKGNFHRLMHIVPSVGIGTKLVKGQQIGTVGNEEYTGFGPHIHYEVDEGRNGQRTNKYTFPISYLRNYYQKGGEPIKLNKYQPSVVSPTKSDFKVTEDNLISDINKKISDITSERSNPEINNVNIINKNPTEIKNIGGSNKVINNTTITKVETPSHNKEDQYL